MDAKPSCLYERASNYPIRRLDRCRRGCGEDQTYGHRVNLIHENSGTGAVQGEFLKKITFVIDMTHMGLPYFQ